MLSIHGEREYDSIFLINSGKMTSFRPTGRLNWQIDTLASWSNSGKKVVKKNTVLAPILPILEVYDVYAFGEAEVCAIQHY